MKVRLKRDAKVYGNAFVQFQFHEGPIKTCCQTNEKDHLQVSIP